MPEAPGEKKGSPWLPRYLQDARTDVNRQRMAEILTAVVLMLLVPAARGQTPQSTSPSLLSQADSVFAAISRITGLPIKASLKKKIVGKPEIALLLKQKLHSELTPKQMAAEEASLKAFGLVPPDFSLADFLLSFYTEQAAGFYDPQTKTMYIADWIPANMQKMVLAHELTHALQDQSFDLEKYLRAADDNDDESNARQAVVEGYATAAMMQYLIQPVPLVAMPSLEGFMTTALNQNPGQYPIFAKAPFFLRFEALFPYAEGLQFMQQGLKLGGWRELNSLFLKPPANTKEIFDPQVYFDHAPQPAISFPQRPRLSHVPGLHLVTENTMGELGYYSLLGQLLSEAEAKKLSPAWSADRYLIFGTDQPNTFILASRTEWNSPRAAAAFFQDYQLILAKKGPFLERRHAADANIFIARTSTGWTVLLHDQNECRWVEGVPKSQVGAMQKWLRSLGS
jgi:hypothetical protein